MRITNGNQPPNNKKKIEKEKLYHKVAIWNKQISHMASNKDGFPIIKRAILKYEPNLVVLTEANISDENLPKVKNKFKTKTSTLK